MIEHHRSSREIVAFIQGWLYSIETGEPELDDQNPVINTLRSVLAYAQPIDNYEHPEEDDQTFGVTHRPDTIVTSGDAGEEERDANSNEPAFKKVTIEPYREPGSEPIIGLVIKNLTEVQALEVTSFVTNLAHRPDDLTTAEEMYPRTTIRKLIDWLERKEDEGCEATGGVVVYEKPDGRVMQFVVSNPDINRTNEYKAYKH